MSSMIPRPISVNTGALSSSFAVMMICDIKPCTLCNTSPFLPSKPCISPMSAFSAISCVFLDGLCSSRVSFIPSSTSFARSIPDSVTSSAPSSIPPWNPSAASVPAFIQSCMIASVVSALSVRDSKNKSFAFASSSSVISTNAAT